MKRRILVTGGLGFIGRHLVEKLKECFDIEYIHIVDNLSNSEYSPFDRLWDDSRISVIVSDVTDFQSSYPYSEIYHLASPVGPAGVLGYAGRMAPMIVDDTYKLALLATKWNARLIDISTSEVYGKDPGSLPQREDIEKVVPSEITVRLEYGVAKLASEVFLTNLVRTTKLQANIIRPFNVVGVGQRGEVGFVIPRFMEAALEGREITVFGDGEQKRCFTSAYDIVDAILLVQGSKNINGEIFNVGNPANMISINELAVKIKELTKSDSEIVHVDPRDIFGPLYAEAWNKIPNINKIKTRLNWAPKWALDDILLAIYKSYL